MLTRNKSKKSSFLLNRTVLRSWQSIGKLLATHLVHVPTLEALLRLKVQAMCVAQTPLRRRMQEVPLRAQAMLGTRHLHSLELAPRRKEVHAMAAKSAQIRLQIYQGPTVRYVRAAYPTIGANDTIMGANTTTDVGMVQYMERPGGNASMIDLQEFVQYQLDSLGFSEVLGGLVLRQGDSNRLIGGAESDSSKVWLDVDVQTTFLG